MSKTTSNYVPGVCNINTEEIKQRRAAGRVGLGIFVVILIGLILVDANRYSRLVLIFPALLMTIGYLQAKNKFCVGYAGSGLQHADNDAAAVSVAADASAKDKRRAKQINRQAVAYAALATLATLLIP